MRTKETMKENVEVIKKCRKPQRVVNANCSCWLQCCKLWWMKLLLCTAFPAAQRPKISHITYIFPAQKHKHICMCVRM